MCGAFENLEHHLEKHDGNVVWAILFIPSHTIKKLPIAEYIAQHRDAEPISEHMTQNVVICSL